MGGIRETMKNMKALMAKSHELQNKTREVSERMRNLPPEERKKLEEELKQQEQAKRAGEELQDSLRGKTPETAKQPVDSTQALFDFKNKPIKNVEPKYIE